MKKKSFSCFHGRYLWRLSVFYVLRTSQRPCKVHSKRVMVGWLVSIVPRNFFKDLDLRVRDGRQWGCEKNVILKNEIGQVSKRGILPCIVSNLLSMKNDGKTSTFWVANRLCKKPKKLFYTSLLRSSGTCTKWREWLVTTKC